MEMMEKVEKLRARANVSYEEAKEALYACDGDLLDAIVMLEKDGKVKKPEQSTYSTSYEKQEKFVSVEEKVNAQAAAENVFSAIRKAIRGFIGTCRGNFFCISRNGDEKVRIPVLLAIIVLCLSWQAAIPAMMISLLLGVRYSIAGKGGLEKANSFMDKASGLAEKIKEDFSAASENKAESSASESPAADGYAAEENMSERSYAEEERMAENSQNF